MFATSLLALAALSASAAAAPLRTAIVADSANPLAFQKIHDAGATIVRINLSWAQSTRKQPSRPSDPSDPAYNWAKTDKLVALAVANGLQPLLTVLDAPVWAQKAEPHPTHQGPFPVGSWRPVPAEVRAFAHAVTTHYSGSVAGIPRVRYWEIWDEPNLTQYLSPQIENGVVASPDIYRELVNTFAAAAHAVHSDNVIVAGSLSAFSFLTQWGRLGIAPMTFMRKLLCMSDGAHPTPTCNATVSFDAWSHHPWTSGGPTHKASEKNDVSLGNLPAMGRLLRAANAAGHIRSAGTPQLWVTEFEWDTRPSDPNPYAAPIDVQARWVAETLYRAWQQHIAVFTWLTIWDLPYPKSSLQGGLFFRNGESLEYAQPKPTFHAFKFPFVAYPAGKKISVWGRTPWGRRASVVVQQRGYSTWTSVGSLKTGADGVFKGKVRRLALDGATAARRVAHAGVDSYRNLVVSAAPLSYWRLDEASGPSATDAMGRSTGRVIGNARFGLKGAVPGSRAIGFDGKTADVQLGSLTRVHSVELWVKTQSLQTRAAFSNRSKLHQFLFLGTDGGLTFAFDDYPIRTQAIANGYWHHVVYTYDSATSVGKVYVDGKLANFAVYPRQEGGSAGYIGYDAALNAYFKGQVDEVAVYGYPLTGAQVRSHFLASGRGIPPAVSAGMVRAVDRRTRAKSLPFSLRRVPDRFVQPFGGGGQVLPDPNVPGP